MGFFCNTSILVYRYTFIWSEISYLSKTLLLHIREQLTKSELITHTAHTSTLEGDAERMRKTNCEARGSVIIQRIQQIQEQN